MYRDTAPTPSPNFVTGDKFAAPIKLVLRHWYNLQSLYPDGKKCPIPSLHRDYFAAKEPGLHPVLTSGNATSLYCRAIISHWIRAYPIDDLHIKLLPKLTILFVLIKTIEMKYVFFFITLFVLTSCDCKKRDILSVDAKLVRSYDTTYEYVGTRKTFDINLTLRNQTRKSITFWIMLCSWEENFLINNYYIKYAGPGCAKNFPVRRTIPPNDSLVYKAMVLRDSGLIIPIIKETKFGFLFIDTLEYEREGELEKFSGNSPHDFDR